MFNDKLIIVKTEIIKSNFKRVYIKDESIPYVGKYLPLQDKYSLFSKINPIFSELIFSTILDYKYCCTTKKVIFKNNDIILLFPESESNLQNCKRKNLQKVKEYIIMLILSVKFLHSRRIIHGNINPSNILLYSDDTIKLCNFKKSSIILSDFKQEFKSKMYKPNYRAPEVWNSDEWSFSSDIWALGCTIFYMLYGIPLFPIQNNDNEYISCLESWEYNIENKNGNSITIPSNWGNPDFHQLNLLILKMCNPNPKLRPSIFEIEQEFLLNKFDISKQMYICQYNHDHFISPAKNTIISALTNYSYEYKCLIILIYSYICTQPKFDHNIFRSSEIIAASLIGKINEDGKLNTEFNITNTYINIIKKNLQNSKFLFFNINKFFGIEK